MARPGCAATISAPHELLLQRKLKHAYLLTMVFKAEASPSQLLISLAHLKHPL